MERLFFKAVSFTYGRDFRLIRIDLGVLPGEILALVGPNGSGKTTLLKLASGLLTPREGEVRLDGVNLARMSRRDIARHIAVVPQGIHIPFALTVREVVALGRTPFRGALAGESARDRGAVAEALAFTGLEEMAGRYFNDLSGGERQKVSLALALAQEPELILLDEPTAYLDIRNQVEILELVRRLARQSRLTVIAAIHDLNLAALYFDRLALLRAGALAAVGPPETVLTESIIRDTFGTAVHVGRHPAAGVPVVTLLPPDRPAPPQ